MPEVAGLVFFVGGFLLMMWAFHALGRNFQLGGIAARSRDEMVTDGPYAFIRHPMYAAALGISLGLPLMVRSWALIAVFCGYLVLILLLMPVEEDGLLKAYRERYAAYGRGTGKLIPRIF